MLSERLLREHPDEVRHDLRRRGAEAEEALVALDEWLALDVERRAAATRHDALALARQALIRETETPPGEPPDAEIPAEPGQLRERNRELAAARRAVETVEARMRSLLLALPNLPDPRVPAGATAAENVELRQWGTPPTFDFTPRRHDAIGAALGILDLPRATRLAGPRFPLLVGEGARLVRALAALMLDLHVNQGYVEIAPPHLLREQTLEGTGHLPRHADELYALPEDRLYLSPTAEAQLVALHAGETLAERDLPRAYTAVTPAYRREAGSANAAMHGLLRQHQFEKVELVRVAAPEQADVAFEALLADAEAVLRRLALPYRVVALCGGDLPWSAQRTYDLEVWLPGQGRYVEISSVSDCGTYQARRLELRYRPAEGGRARYPHTLNAAALAIGRTLAALLENGQRADASVVLPSALAPYLGGATKLVPHRPLL